jgi:hypothetical protein
MFTTSCPRFQRGGDGKCFSLFQMTECLLGDTKDARKMAVTVNHRLRAWGQEPSAVLHHLFAAKYANKASDKPKEDGRKVDVTAAKLRLVLGWWLPPELESDYSDVTKLLTTHIKKALVPNNDNEDDKIKAAEKAAAKELQLQDFAKALEFVSFPGPEEDPASEEEVEDSEEEGDENENEGTDDEEESFVEGSDTDTSSGKKKKRKKVEESDTHTSSGKKKKRKKVEESDTDTSSGKKKKRKKERSSKKRKKPTKQGKVTKPKPPSAIEEGKKDDAEKEQGQGKVTVEGNEVDAEAEQGPSGTRLEAHGTAQSAQPGAISESAATARSEDLAQTRAMAESATEAQLASENKLPEQKMQELPEATGGAAGKGDTDQGASSKETETVHLPASPGPEQETERWKRLGVDKWPANCLGIPNSTLVKEILLMPCLDKPPEAEEKEVKFRKLTLGNIDCFICDFVPTDHLKNMLLFHRSKEFLKSYEENSVLIDPFDVGETKEEEEDHQRFLNLSVEEREGPCRGRYYEYYSKYKSDKSYWYEKGSKRAKEKMQVVDDFMESIAKGVESVITDIDFKEMHGVAITTTQDAFHQKAHLDNHRVILSPPPPPQSSGLYWPYAIAK